jgi:heme exporter protein C
MGDAQRVLYVHVPVAWLALIDFVVVAASGLLYLLRRDLRYDRWACAAAEVGWLCSCLTLVTGSLWAHAAWGTWWTWDPRLASAFILWSLYGGYLLTRRRLDDPHARARVAAVLAIVGVLDVPLVVMATRWFRAIHPTAPTLEPSMRLTLGLTFAGLAVFTSLLVVCRRSQLRVENLLETLDRAGEP